MELTFTQKKSIRKNFGKLKETLSIPNLIEVQRNSYEQFLSIMNSAFNSTSQFGSPFKSGIYNGIKSIPHPDLEIYKGENLKKKSAEELSKVTGGLNLPSDFKLPF